MCKKTPIKNLAVPFITSCFAVVLGLAILHAPILGGILALIPALLWISLHKPRFLLYLLIFFLPFQFVPILSQNLAGIPGAKISNLLAAGAMLLLFLQEGNLLRFRDSIEKKAMFVMGIYFFFFSVSFFRSIENLQLFSFLLPEQFKSSAVSYALSFYVRPALYLIPPLIILKTFRTRKQLEEVINVLLVSVFILSCCIILIVLAHFAEFSQGRGVMRELCSNYLGMHYNSVGTIFIVSTPLIILKMFSKKPFWLISGGAAALAILCLQSRTTLVVSVMVVILFLYLIQKKKLMLAVIIIGLPVVFAWTPEVIMQNLNTGIEEKTADAMLTGRVSHLWAPLLKEWVADPYKLFLGEGQFGLLTSPLWASGFLVQAVQAHNAFINFFLNNGIILSSALVSFILWGMKKAWQQCKLIDTPFCWALFLIIIAYLMGTLTERYIYPHQDNMLLLPLIAILVNLIRLYQYEPKSHIESGEK